MGASIPEQSVTTARGEANLLLVGGDRHGDRDRSRFIADIMALMESDSEIQHYKDGSPKLEPK